VGPIILAEATNAIIVPPATTDMTSEARITSTKVKPLLFNLSLIEDMMSSSPYGQFNQLLPAGVPGLTVPV